MFNVVNEHIRKDQDVICCPIIAGIFKLSLSVLKWKHLWLSCLSLPHPNNYRQEGRMLMLLDAQHRTVSHNETDPTIHSTESESEAELRASTFMFFLKTVIVTYSVF